jgi:TonB family protein
VILVRPSPDKQVLISNRPQPWGPAALALLGALLVHAALLAGIEPLMEQDAVEPPTPRPQTRVVVRQMTDEQIAKLIKPREPKPKPPEPKPPEEEPPKPEDKPPEPAEPHDQRKVVIQETNEQLPADPKYLSPQANKTEVETRATETTLKNVLPGPPDPNVKEDATTPEPDPKADPRDEDPAPSDTPTPSEPVASRVEPPKRAPKQTNPRPDSRRPIEPEPRRELPKDGPGDVKPAPDESDPAPEADPDTSKEDDGKVDPRKLFPTMNDYDKVFGESDAKHAEAARVAEAGRQKKRSFANMGDRQRALRASLENMITEVQPGNHTSVNAAPAIYAGYMAALHRRIHQRWPDYLMTLDTSYPAGHPLQKATLQVTLELVIEAKSGEFKAVNIVRSSGQMMFDAEAIDTAWSLGKQPNAPKQIISPDGKVYIHWNFWRDGRQCGLFGAAIYIVHRDAKGNPVPFKADDPDQQRPRDTRGMRD